MMAFLPPSFGIAAPFKTNNTLYFAILFAIPAAELIFHIILLALRSKKAENKQNITSYFRLFRFGTAFFISGSLDI